jgi:hypothetical protein
VTSFSAVGWTRYHGGYVVVIMRRVDAYVLEIGLFLSIALIALSGCSPTSPSVDIPRERAIELARQHISFEPTSTSADTDSRQGRPVWVVTFRMADGSHGGLGQFAEITLDRRTGELVTTAMS